MARRFPLEHAPIVRRQHELLRAHTSPHGEPARFQAPERRELTEEERIYVNSGGVDPRDAEEAQAKQNTIAGTGVTVFDQAVRGRGYGGRAVARGYVLSHRSQVGRRMVPGPLK